VSNLRCVILAYNIPDKFPSRYAFRLKPAASHKPNGWLAIEGVHRGRIENTPKLFVVLRCDNAMSACHTYVAAATTLSSIEQPLRGGFPVETGKSDPTDCRLRMRKQGRNIRAHFFILPNYPIAPSPHGYRLGGEPVIPPKRRLPRAPHATACSAPSLKFCG
jgi:hypothetical protein